MPIRPLSHSIESLAECGGALCLKPENLLASLADKTLLDRLILLTAGQRRRQHRLDIQHASLVIDLHDFKVSSREFQAL